MTSKKLEIPNYVVFIPIRVSSFSLGLLIIATLFLIGLNKRNLISTKLYKNSFPIISAALLWVFCYNAVIAQEQDSLDLKKIQQINPVVLTGQFNPQAVDKSIFEVQVIGADEISRQAGTSLADVLQQNLNLSILPNAAGGRTGINQFGFGSDYIKILVDNVPVIGDEGFGNSIDISQINLDDIQQIEIVEGAMGVQYGSDAVTGVINIITKKSSAYKWQIAPYIQEETVGKEYAWPDKGKHIQSLKIGHNISGNWFAQLGITHTDFGGFQGDRQKQNYFNPDNANDGLRGYEWAPKRQNDFRGLLSYKSDDNFSGFYKFQYFKERLERLDENVKLNPNNATQTFNPTAKDHVFKSLRLYHNLNFNGKIFDRIRYDLSASYQAQRLNDETYTYHIKQREKSNLKRRDYNTRKGFFSRGTFNDFFDSRKFNLELGYEVNADTGTASGLAGQSSEENTQKNKLNTYSTFVSSELKVTDRLTLRPGFRLLTSSKFKDLYAYSFSGSYLFDNGYQLRTIVGSSPKTPTFEQLFFFLVDANHDVRGNDLLRPEQGRSVFLHFKKTYLLSQNEIRFTPKLSGWYLDVKDKIDLIIVNPSPLAYQYENINSFKTLGLALRNQVDYKNLNTRIGLAISGESKELKAETLSSDGYLYSLQLNAKLDYRIPQWNTVFSVFYKYNGPEYQYVNVLDDNGQDTLLKARQDGYSWLNASVRKTFFDRKLELTLGGRNLLNLRSVRNSVLGNTADIGTAHDGGSNTLVLGYGASAYIKLQYNLNL